MKSLVILFGIVTSVQVMAHEDPRCAPPEQTRNLTRVEVMGDFPRWHRAAPFSQRSNVSSLAIQLTQGRAQLDRVQVDYCNGTTEAFPIGEQSRGGRVFEMGDQSRWLNLNGERRCVRDVQVFGQHLMPRGASVVNVIARQYDAQPILIGATSLGMSERAKEVDTRDVCGISAVAVKVYRKDVRIDYIGVRFADGTFDQLEVRERIKANGSTRFVDLDGGRRCITSFYIDGQMDEFSLRNKAVVELVGIQ